MHYFTGKKDAGMYKSLKSFLEEVTYETKVICLYSGGHHDRHYDSVWECIINIRSS